MDLHGPNSRVDARIDIIVKSFGDNSFTSAQFIQRFSEKYPKTWDAILKQYGLGGKGTGKSFTSSSFIGSHLEKRKYNHPLLKLDRVRSPSGWGNPWISVWANLSYSGAALFPDEIPEQYAFLEGAKTLITVNRFERDGAARKKCIAHYGTNCSVCSMNFSNIYGPTVKDFIHVHHIKPLSTIGK